VTNDILQGRVADQCKMLQQNLLFTKRYTETGLCSPGNLETDRFTLL